jgi:hypothetical protein
MQLGSSADEVAIAEPPSFTMERDTMPVQLCAECYLQSYCRRLISRAVEDQELTPVFIADVRAFMRSVNLTRDAWKGYLIDGYAAYPGRIVDTQSREVFLDTSVYDAAGIRYWFRDLLRPIPPGVTPRLKLSARERFRVTASILKALHPVAASLWGRIIANDDPPRNLPVAVRKVPCPYPHFTIG